ncbi:hypothetical protein [Mesorhizobium sp. 1B3]|uniref:hypothetical protein n=1 Tax=Mesorhizobium sp. 1B3 TaxID=3243599 RepID=UPI003D97702B
MTNTLSKKPMSREDLQAQLAALEEADTIKTLEAEIASLKAQLDAAVKGQNAAVSKANELESILKEVHMLVRPAADRAVRTYGVSSKVEAELAANKARIAAAPPVTKSVTQVQAERVNTPAKLAALFPELSGPSKLAAVSD